jgi:hypothetical protein
MKCCFFLAGKEKFIIWMAELVNVLAIRSKGPWFKPW